VLGSRPHCEADSTDVDEPRHVELGEVLYAQQADPDNPSYEIGHDVAFVEIPDDHVDVLAARADGRLTVWTPAAPEADPWTLAELGSSPGPPVLADVAGLEGLEAIIRSTARSSSSALRADVEPRLVQTASARRAGR
jgi:hypothetical protein